MLCPRCNDSLPQTTAELGRDWGVEQLRCSRCGEILIRQKESELARFGLFALRRPGWARLRQDAD